MSELKMEQDRIKFSRTILGRFYNFLGYFFSGYCLYKLFMVRNCLPSHALGLTILGNNQHCVRSHHQTRSSHARTAYRPWTVPRGHWRAVLVAVHLVLHDRHHDCDLYQRVLEAAYEDFLRILIARQCRVDSADDESRAGHVLCVLCVVDAHVAATAISHHHHRTFEQHSLQLLSPLVWLHLHPKCSVHVVCLVCVN